MLATLKTYARIAVQLARVGVVRKSQLQVEFWAQVIMDCLWYASHVAVFEVFFMHAPEIAGWDRAEFRVLIGFLFVSDAFMMVWLGQMWRFGRDLKDGKLDPFRVRPASTLFLYAFQQFSLEGCVNLAVSFSYLTYGIGIAIPNITLGGVLIALACVALSCWMRLVVMTLFSLFELYAIGSDATRFFHELFHSASDRPVDVFGARVRAFLIYIIPIGALTTVPAAIVLGHYTALETLATVAWLGVLGFAIFAAWGRAFRNYESAMG
jgi:ABC-2 type transport system permease protein